MMELTWERFNAQNGSGRRKRFQDLCQQWFNMEKVKDFNTSHENTNQAGIESEPIEIKTGEIANFQAKYFDVAEVDYAQIRKSLKRIPDYNREKLNVIYLCSNRNIDTDKTPFKNIQKMLAKDDIRVKAFSDNDILLWAEKQPDIIRAYWGSDILEIRDDVKIAVRNTDITNKKIDALTELFDNIGVKDNGNLTFVSGRESGETDDDPVRIERKDSTNSVEESISKQIQYLTQKQILTNIDRCINFFNSLISGEREKDFKNTSELDEYAYCFLQVLFCCNTIKRFNTELFLNALEKIIPFRPLYKIVALRWKAIEAHFVGDVKQSISIMEEALNRAKVTKQPTWFIQDILIDLRNENYILDAMENIYLRTSDAQKELSAFETDLHYPILDRQKQDIYKRYIVDLYKKKVSSPHTIELGSNLNSYAKDFAQTFIISVCNGSLTQIRLIYSELRIFFFCCCERYDDWHFRFEMFKMAILADGKRISDEIVKTYPELIGNLTKEQACELLQFCDNEPIENRRLINQFNGLSYVGYVLSDHQFNIYYQKLKDYIYSWLKDENGSVEIGSAIFPCLSHISLRVKQDDLANICCAFIDSNYRRWYDEMFQFMQTCISLDKLSEETANELLNHIISLIKDDDCQNDILRKGNNPLFLCVFRKDCPERTEELDRIIKDYMPSFYNDIYKLETMGDSLEVATEYLDKYLDIAQKSNKTQGANGCFHTSGFNHWKTINAILVNTGISVTVEMIKKLIAIATETIISSNEKVDTKMDALTVLITIAIKNKDSFQENLDVKTIFKDLGSGREIVDSLGWDTNTKEIALFMGINVLSCITGENKYLDLMKMLPELNHSPASVIAIEELMIQGMNCSEELILPKELTDFCLQNALYWIQNEKVLVRRKAVNILLLLLKNKNYHSSIYYILEQLYDNQDQYIKNLIQRKIYQSAEVTDDFKQRIAERSKNNSHFAVRYVYKKEYQKRD